MKVIFTREADTVTTGAECPRPRQIPLDLDWPRKRAMRREDFIEGSCNADALAAIEGWQGWKDGRLVLSGPEGSGKTHLAAIWAARTDAVFIDIAALTGDNLRDVAALGHVILEDIDTRIKAMPDPAETETAMFHLFNLMTERQGRILFTGRALPARWPINLPDLATRLSLPPVFRVGRPDDTVLSSLILKLFDDRSLSPDGRVADYLAVRVERSFEAVHAMVGALDAYSVETKRPVTVKLAKDLFGW